MKKGLFLILSLTLSYLSMAQVPNSFSYQMVIRNGNNELVANTTVGIRIGLLGGNAADTVWYEEEHKVKTNLNGLAYIIIGKGNILKGAISTIDWTRGPFFIKSETDPTGGTNYSLIIVSQMLSVPYAIYAGTAEKLSTPVTETDPLFNKSIAKGITAADTALWNTETDPVFSKSISKGITESDITYWNNKLSSFGETDPTFNASISKGITAVDTAYWNKKLSSFSETDPLFNQSVAKGITALDTLKWNSLLNLSDTILRSDMILGKLNISDTSAMLSNYRTGINAKVNVSDTAGMLTPYLRKLDTASVSNRINLKVNIADTAGMLTPYLRKLDTVSVSNRINLKVNIADTASMLEPYLREPVGPVNGDILYYNINKWERLPKGQDGQFLTLSSGIPNWTSIAPGSPTGVSAIAGNGQVTVSFTAPTNTGGTPITGYTVTSSPSGGTATGTNLSLTVTGLTNGTSYTFTVVATNSVGNSAASLSSTPVTPCINTAGPASSTLSLCINTTLSNITHSTSGATGIGSAIGLPTGVSAAWASNTITISGTPTVSGTFNYSIPLTGGCGSVNATGTITVTDANIAGAASSTPTLCINTLLIDITHSTLGATGIGSATGLPTGVSAAWASNTITISGTPNASGTFNYSIPLTGGCGSVNATGTITVACIPTVTTTAISSITTTGASSGGNVTDEGGVSVIARGVVYSTSPNPTISNSTTSNGTGAGSFTSTLTSLTSATTYYVRAYATNSLGTAYGNELTFSTSAPIPTATLNCPSALGGIITFMKHNLGANQAADPLTPSWELNGDYWLWGRQTKAADGPTESNTNAGAISGWNSGSLTLGAMGSSAAWLDGSKTANDPCPSGFRVPTKEQWRCVIENNTKTYQGTWSTGFGSPTNYSTGLTLTSGSVSIFLPAAGSRASNYDVSVGTGGDLQYRGRYGNYLSSSLDGSTYYFMQFYDGGNASGTWTTGRTYGYSVRCVAE